MADQQKIVDYLKWVSADLRATRQRLEEAESRLREPVAVVGIACRFPGGIGSAEDLWRVVSDGVDAVSGFPTDRGWDLARIYHPDPDHPGTSYVREGGFLTGVADFDAEFFGISPREALAMDPQQRLLLEVSWELFERSGIDPAHLHGTRTGVFVGANSSEYVPGVGGAPRDVEGYVFTGNTLSVASGRLAYVYGFQGPAVTVDTACSSSLVAIHLACQSLRTHDCSLAIAGGVTIMGSPAVFVELSRQRALSPDGRCKAFSATANGFGPSEGAGLVLLERLSDAHHNNHPILAIIRGSAINQDGASSGLTAPNSTSQEQVIRTALTNAGLQPHDIHAVEAHGTGTALGDPIEAQALIATYGQAHTPHQPLWIGSVKSNIAHTASAAGIAGMIKMIMAMRHGTLPKTLHADQPSPHIDWNAGIALLTTPTPWPTTNHPRRAGVSSFGISGTNAHLILEHTPPPPTNHNHHQDHNQPTPLILSARTPTALHQQITHLRNYTTTHPHTNPHHIAAQLTTRPLLPHRAVLINNTHIQNTANDNAKIAYLLPGQGAQRTGMGHQLYTTYPAYAQAFDEICDTFGDQLPLHKLITDGGPTLDQTQYAQPALFAVEVALFRLLESWGLQPDFLLGHSIGEIAAAHLAGVLTLPDACTLVATRGRLMQTAPTHGAMAAIEATPDELAETLHHHQGRATLAAINGPNAVVISGDHDAVHAITTHWATQGRRTRQLTVSHAFHSPHMDGITDALTQTAATITTHPPRIPLISCLTGDFTTPEQLNNPQYWATQARNPVQFHNGIQRLATAGTTIFIETGPGSGLATMGQTCLTNQPHTHFIPTLNKHRPEPETLLTAISQAWTAGARVQWDRLFTGTPRTGLDLPTYPFQRRRYWLQRPAADMTSAGLGHTDHPLLPAVLRLADQDTAILSGRISLHTTPWLADHVINDTIIFPGTGYIELAIRAGDEMGYGHLEELTLHTPLTIPPDTTIPIQVRVGPPDDTNRRPIAIYTTTNDQPTRHATGILTNTTPPPPDTNLTTWPPPDATPIPTTDTYTNLRQHGYQYGPTFQGLHTAWQHGTTILAEVALPPTEHPNATHYSIHPALLDACLHAAATTTNTTTLQLPFTWTNVHLHATAATTARVRIQPTSPDTVSLTIWDEAGVPVCEVRSIRMAPYAADTRPATPPGGSAGQLFRVVWLPLGLGDLPGADDAGGVVSVTQSAVLVTAGDPLPDHAMASAWDEHPEDRPLVDIDEDPESLRLLPAVAASGEPRAAIRGGRAFVPRLRRVEAKDPEVALAGTALVVGGDAELPGLDVVTARTADRDQLARMLEEHRPSVVVVRDDPRLAQDLHELTAGMDLTAFVMVSCGTYGDALARHRHGLGLPAVSLPAQALPSLASALAAGDPVVVAEHMDLSELRALAAAGTLPARWRSLVRVPARLRASGKSSLARRLAAASQSEQARLVLALVRAEAAAVLGQPSPELIDIDRGFLEQGFDSLTAVELRNRLAGATGLPLPSTIIFDQPSPAKLASWVRGELLGGAQPAPAPPARTAPGSDDLVAVVGMACRFPGGVDSPDGLWQVVSGGVDAISGFPTDRGWDLPRIYHPDPDHPGTSYVREGGFLTGVADFDAEFFGISPREALAMDPQQRLLLEVSWEALERATIDPWSLRGSRTGVYVGALGSDYIQEMQRTPPRVEGLAMTGNAFSVMSGRVSYVLGLEGPAVSVDTACSSSLVATHLARQALLLGECDLALAAGVTVFASPSIFVELSRQRAVAPDGRCKAFSARADGLSTAEGVGVLVLERLSDARRNGHPVLAVVRGSAVNQDGASSGLTAPSGPSQERVIRAALASAGLRPEDVDAVEAHGTGTALGDPIEAQALIATYGQERETPLWVGSVKSNIGHAQAAAGAAGLIKMVLALRHGMLPRTLHVDELSPHVDWSSGAVSVLTEPRPWPGQDGRPRRAGVSSFGISGTNAHVILEEAPPSPTDLREDRPAIFGPGSAIPWVISGAGPAALRDQAVRLREFVAEHPEVDARTIGSALTTRTALPYRALVLGADRDELCSRLADLAAGEPEAGTRTGSGTGEIVMVFPGQGSEWAGMGMELLSASPVFSRRMRECDDALRPFTGWSLLDVLREEAPDLDRTDIVQPLLFAMMVSLAELWQQAGVRVVAVVGHSQGEIAAACVAGALSLEDAARIVALRSQALLKITGAGGMASVAADPEAITAWLDDRLSIAAVNGPNAVVVSGETTAIDQLVERCTAEGLRARRLSPRYASHSPQIESLRDEILSLLAPVAPRRSEVALYSTVTGALTDGSGLDAEYWYRSLRQPVEFEKAVRALLADGRSIFVEVSPHPVLTVALTETFEAAGSDAVAVGTLRRGEGGCGAFLSAAGQAWAAGARVQWDRLFTGTPRTGLDLPTYPFQRRRYWLQRPAADMTSAGLGHTDHPLLPAVLRLADQDTAILSGRISLHTTPWLADHVINDTIIFPGTGYIELAIRAGDEMGYGHLEELTLHTPLTIPPDTTIPIQVRVGPPDDTNRRPIAIYTTTNDQPTRHATGILTNTTPPPPDTNLTTWPPPDATPIPTTDTYTNLRQHGYQYGPTFQGLHTAWQHGTTILAEVALPPTEHPNATHYSIHPALLDACLHAAATTTNTTTLQLPFTWTNVHLHATAATTARVRIQPTSPDRWQVTIADSNGAPILTAASVVFRPAPTTTTPPAATDAIFRVDWVPAPQPQQPPTEPTISHHPLTAHIDWGNPPPQITAIHCPGEHTDPEQATATAITLLQNWLADERLTDHQLVMVTRHAIGPDTDNLTAAPIWGLLRSAQTENPGRFVIIDTDDTTDLTTALATGEPQLMIRHGQILVPRLARGSAALQPPPGQPAWRVEAVRQGTLEDITTIPAPEALTPLQPGQVRIAMRAAGLNFRDVVVGLGMIPGQTGIGNEGAGTIIETGPDTDNLHVGDRVMGIIPAAFGPIAITNHQLITPIPDTWSWQQAAAIPIAFLTAYYGLADLAQLQPGQTVLIHAAAGGVGMAAVQLAQHWGAEVFATASPSKWPTLHAMGIDPTHIASSRTLEFQHQFRTATHGRGIDVILNSLTGEFIDASLQLLTPGGRFIEMGKTDIRQPDHIAHHHPTITYRAFDLTEASPHRIHQMLTHITTLLHNNTLTPPPITTWDIRRAREAFRHMSRALHTGKIVLTIPPPLNPNGTILITGGTGTLGAITARHLATNHNAKHLLLISRQGPNAPNADQLKTELTNLGANVTITACDAANRDALAHLLTTIPPEHPLTAVIHTAGTLHDATLTTLTPQHLHTVFQPKAQAALNLHELTTNHDLATFTLYSSAAALMGNPGQANYAAANALLDALAHHRTNHGQPTTSIAWGMWDNTTGMTAHLTHEDLARLTRNGALPITPHTGMPLLDTTHNMHEPHLLASPTDTTKLHTLATNNQLNPLWHNLIHTTKRPTANTTTNTTPLKQQLKNLTPQEQHHLLLTLTQTHTATVLAHPNPNTINPNTGFLDLGIDSLTALELRNRLTTTTGLHLPPTLIFDHPTPNTLAQYLRTRLAPDAVTKPVNDEPATGNGKADAAHSDTAIDSMSVDELIRLAHNQDPN